MIPIATEPCSVAVRELRRKFWAAPHPIPTAASGHWEEIALTPEGVYSALISVNELCMKSKQDEQLTAQLFLCVCVWGTPVRVFFFPIFLTAAGEWPQQPRGAWCFSCKLTPVYP